MFYGMKVRTRILKSVVGNPQYGPETSNALGRAISYVPQQWKSLLERSQERRLSPEEGAFVIAAWLSAHALADRLGFPIRRAMGTAARSIQATLSSWAPKALDRLVDELSAGIVVDEDVAVAHISALADALIRRHSVVEPKIFPTRVNDHVIAALQVELESSPNLNVSEAALIKLALYKSIMADLGAPAPLIASFDKATYSVTMANPAAVSHLIAG